MTTMLTRAIPGTERHASVVGLGTWAIGGWMWGEQMTRRPQTPFVLVWMRA